MPDSLRGTALWMVRGASVLLAVAASVRYFGDSSTSDTAANLSFALALALGLTGIATATVQRRKAASASEKDDPGAA